MARRILSLCLVLSLGLSLLLPILARPASASTGPDGAAGVIHGTVVDPDGRPAPDARVLVASRGAVVAAAATDADGRVRFEGLPPGAYELRVALPGFQADPPAFVRLGAGDAREVTLRLRLAAIAESVVVTAAQAELPLSRTPDSVTVLSTADLEARQIRTVADALRLVPGLAVAQSGGHGALTSVFPRGGESDYTLVLVDGVRVNDFGGAYDFAHLPAAAVERIEIVRGPQSALHGADAIGAVVHVISKHGGRATLDGGAEAGSLGTSRLSLATAGSRGPWSWGAGAERLESEGVTGRAASGERVANDDYERRHAAAGAGWNGARGARIRGNVRYTTATRGFPGPFGSDPAGLFGGVDLVSRGEQTSRLLAVSADSGRRGRFRHHAQVSHADLDGEFASPFGDSASESRRFAARARTDAAAGPLGLSGGLELQRERARSTFITGETFDPVPVNRRILGSFGEARYERGGRLFAAAGLRVEHITRDALEGNPNPFAPRPPFPADAILSANPKLAVSWLLRPPDERARRWTRLRAGAGTGIRPPDGFQIAFTDNPGLRPECSRSLEAGVEQVLAAGALHLHATAFLNRYEDLIVAVGRSFQDASRYRTDNIANARARGLELAAAARPRRGLELSAAYTWLDTAVLAVDGTREAPPPFAVGDPLIRRPRHHATFQAVLTRGRVAAHVLARARGRALDIEPTFGAFGGLFDNPGHAAIDAGAIVRLRRGVDLTGRVTNLLDRRYEETLGFPAPRRGAIVGVRVAAR